MSPRWRGHCAPQGRAQAQPPVLGPPKSPQPRRAHPHRSAWPCECPADAREGVSRLGLWIKVPALQLWLGCRAASAGCLQTGHRSVRARRPAPPRAPPAFAAKADSPSGFPPSLKASLTKCPATHTIRCVHVIMTGHARAAVSPFPHCAWATRLSHE